MNWAQLPKSFRTTPTVVTASLSALFVFALFKPVSHFRCLKWLLLPSYLPGPSPPTCLAPCAPSAMPPHHATCAFLPLCCWPWPALLLGPRERVRQSRFSLTRCLAPSSSELHLLVMGTQLHLQLLQLLAQTFHPVPSVSVWHPKLACQSQIQLPLIQLSRETGKLWQKYSVILNERLIVPLIKLLLANNTSV